MKWSFGNKRRFFVVIVAAYFFCAIVSSAGLASELGAPEIVLGPRLSPLYSPRQIRGISFDYQWGMERYGVSMYTWPHAERVAVCDLLRGVDHLPEGLLFSCLPEADDLSEDLVLEAALDGLARAYSLADSELAWYAKGHTIAFVSESEQAPRWWVRFFPYPNDRNGTHLTGEQPKFIYHVQLSRAGQVLSVAEQSFQEDDPLASPLDAFAFYLQGLVFADERPRHLWTDEEKLDLNYQPLFPHFRGNTVLYGLPGENDLPRDEVIALAKEAALRIGGIGAGDQVMADASFLIGESQNGSISNHDAYPQWSVHLMDAQGYYLCTINVSAATGELLKYER